MRSFRIFTVCLLASLFYAVASTQQPGILELKGAVGKASWAEYKSGMQALETDPLTAIHYFDLALEELYSEQQMDSLGLPEDSVYYYEMPKHIILVLESLYPKLISQGIDQPFSMRNDYETYYYDEFDEFDEFFNDFKDVPLDSMEKLALSVFLDTMDLSKISLPIVINDRVKREIRFLSVSTRKFTEGALSRKTALDSMIYAKLRQRGLPEDLIYLAFVESGFKVNAYSRAKAAGVWQFIPATGRRYDLPVDFWLDMRRNPEAATDAALDYLTDLYNEFGDWYLAMAAYNCGEGRIRRFVKEGQETDPNKKISYWDLKLHRETMHYVPRILAAAIIGHFPEHYSFKVEKQSLLPYDTVTVNDCISLDKVGTAVGSSANTIRDLNPELVRFCTPPNLKSYTMKVPEGTREKFLAAYAKMDKTQTVRWQQYKVQRGDNLGTISRFFGVKAADIQSANNLRNSRLRVGQVLIIPVSVVGIKASTAQPVAAKKQDAAISPSIVEPAQVVEASPRTTYTVRNGDNLASISKRFGVSQQNLMTWNDLRGSKIMTGQRLYLQDPSKKTIKKNEPLVKSTSEAASYEIKQGDNLWEIARNHNVTVQQLLEWNPGLDKKIYPGMKIKVSE
ncbi:MAG: LysM peptidoglycan-binding domain-containing protein [Fibromonadaceae bacterium]|jgi:membrane-bound lytic murein transglycosylase D|nr:LysM peptidoglycan-binding domain-containing protein [Fibromonadaceae bacterium]